MPLVLTRRLARFCPNHRMFEHTSQGCKNNVQILSEKPLGESASHLWIRENYLYWLTKKCDEQPLKNKCSSIWETQKNRTNTHTNHILNKQTPTHKSKSQHQKRIFFCSFLEIGFYSRFVTVHLGLPFFLKKTKCGRLEATASVTVYLTLNVER